jgi:ADP-ribose pyrophosphatase YjhB (NUDIX family)
METDPLRVRAASRILLLDPNNRLLLLRVNVDGETRFWLAPGGGLNDGEDYETAALRNLFFQTGVSDIELSQCVWQRSRVMIWDGVVYDAREHFFVARVRSNEEVSADQHDDAERDLLLEHRWWSIAEIEASDDVFAPSSLARLLVPIVLGRLPPEPLLIEGWS